MLLYNFQQKQRIRTEPPKPYETATIFSISGNTARLTFPDGNSQKNYQIMSNETLAVGQRVQIKKVSGTYIILGGT